jgi:salicylate hydroxylase
MTGLNSSHGSGEESFFLEMPRIRLVRSVPIVLCFHRVRTESGTQHLGQGANQALEDIYHLVRLLNKHNASASQPSTKTLEQVFQEYQGLRIPVTTKLVKEARRRGEVRVVSGVEACKRRNELVKAAFSDGSSRKAQAELLSGPFRESEL